MSNGMPVSGIVYLTIPNNENIEEQKKVFESICRFLGLMDNNLPKEEIHHVQDNIYYYDQGQIHWSNSASMFQTLNVLEIDYKLTVSI
jgi:hypothetical protein